ncbi:putative 50s ribosomal protein L33 [Tilletiopsis washingtonensis]|uniref:Large ribosomal subunit protein bL33m n=1 Tax=Tilletiopsis washingtonensis TaxID=58919 RepID=A0A316Z599_9BASI|nr:putative 50s ribosomal protein L33 [Tilletiopsis washingtonensis]PWN96779.1 putative 50s ribosomal protein L33 [Tilletiopsis washingtonensis]
MAAKSKARVIIARLMSTAGTGYFYTTTRLRTADRIVMRKYDPKVKQHVLFRETKK